MKWESMLFASFQAFGGGPGALAASGVTGLGIIFECVAAAMGWQTVAEAGTRVHLSLASLAGRTPGFEIPRNPRGFWSHFYDPNTGATQDDDGCMMYVLLSTYMS